MIAVDTETTGVMFHDRAFLASFAFRHGSELRSHVAEIPAEVDVCRTVMENMKPWLFHNAKFDLQKLIQAGVIKREQVSVDSFHDTQTIAYLINEHQELGLKKLAKNLLGEETNELEAINQEKKRLKKELGLQSVHDVSYDLIPREVLTPYALKDAEFTLRLFEILYPLLPEEMYRLYDMERELILVLLDVEARGIKIDTAYLEEKEEEYRKKIFYKELEIKELAGDDDFNPNSPQQVLKWYEDNGYVILDTTRKSLVEADVPLGLAIVELKKMRKLHGTYMKGLLAEVHDGLVHPNFNPARTKTGRMSSSGSAD